MISKQLESTGTKIRTYGNEQHFVCNIGLLYKLLGDQCLYDKNRPIRDDIVEDIIKYQESYYHRYEKYNYGTGKIVIGTVGGKDPKILDGQHRLKSASFLDGIILADVVVIDHKDDAERFDTYITINKSTPVPDLYKTSELQYRKVLDDVINKLSWNIFSAAPHPQRPFENKIV